MKSTSTAEAISAQLLALLPQHPAEATVHSVFHTSANLLYQGQLVTLLDDTRPLYPCAVRLGGSIPSGRSASMYSAILVVNAITS